MREQYALTDYSYLVCYNETSSGMYHYNVDKVVIEEGRIYFDYDDESKKGNNYEVVTGDMSGWCYLAAIPKHIIQGRRFKNVVYPDAHDFTQSKEYSFRTDYGMNAPNGAFGVAIKSRFLYDYS